MLCIAPGASVGFVGCLRIRDAVVNHFPHPRPFHLCPRDHRSSALEPCMGTVPARETATELHVGDGGRMSSVSRTLLLPLSPRKNLEGTTAASQKLTAKHKQQGCWMFLQREMVTPSFTSLESHLCPPPLFNADSYPGEALFKGAEFR